DYIEGTEQLYPGTFEGYIKTWTVNLNASISGGTLFPIQEGWHVVTLTVEPEINECNDTPFTYSDIDSIYVSLLEPPDIFISVTGPTLMCPGDTIVLQYDYTGTLTGNFGVAQNFLDSAYIDSPGFYNFSVDSTAENGCVGFASQQLNISLVPSPQIFTDPPNAIICPGDSVELLSNNEGDFLWQGPIGSVAGDNSLWVSESGLYFAEVTFYEGCALVSNTVQLAEYATPFLYAESDSVCQGGSTDIWVFSNSLETIEWLPPLFGTDSIQTVFDPGVYSVTVTGCEITTDISIEIFQNEPEVEISLVSEEPKCEGDSIQVQASGEFVEYAWTPSGQGPSTWFESSGPVSVNAFTDEGCQAVSNTLQLNFEPNPPDPDFQFELPCIGEPMQILISSNLEVNVLNEEDGNVVSNDSIQNIESLSGDTIIYAYLNSEYCIGDTVALELSPKLYPDEPIPTTDAPVCTGTSLSLEVLNAEAGVNYIWLTPTGNILEGDIVSYGISSLDQEGEYLAYANLEDCLSDTVGIDVSLFQTRQVTLPPDTALCFIPNFNIAPDTLYQSYQWFDGSSDSIFIPDFDAALSISLTTTDFNGCRSSDLMLIDFADCIIQIPNIITPNGDGLNDQWVIGLDRPQFFDVVIYNRWGQVVYESKDFSTFWDGTHYQSGELCSEGIYFYIIRVNDFEGRAFEQQGDLTVIRD
ncbi:MAG: gliding motility-associated C-terminal domain-containing protein, partial [Cryomorphaceae bacterium]